MRLDVMRCHGLRRPTSGSKIGISEGQLDYIPYSWDTFLNESKVTRISRFFMFTHHAKIDKAPSYPIRVPERHS